MAYASVDLLSCDLPCPYVLSSQAVERLQWTRAVVIRHGSTSDTSHSTSVGVGQWVLQTLSEVCSRLYGTRAKGNENSGW